MAMFFASRASRFVAVASAVFLARPAGSVYVVSVHSDRQAAERAASNPLNKLRYNFVRKGLCKCAVEDAAQGQREGAAWCQRVARPLSTREEAFGRLLIMAPPAVPSGPPSASLWPLAAALLASMHAPP
mmetsp:Transcript_124024/g.356050  ORF Transcript_124024/g.356050 Transcript_124024/m.356050 type:complete len:129 (-) Transcript_124024:569-955(-)